MNAEVQRVAGTARRMPTWQTVPAEGENGLFSQSWFPVSLAADIPPGKPVGIDFLDGRIVVWRRGDGSVAAMSAYCPHVGADLSVGRVVGDHLQCAFHHFEYDFSGQCVKTGIGDPPPPNACLFVYPTQERYGIIWVFNGETPLFDLPELPYGDDEVEREAFQFPMTFNCDPWVFAANTPDMQHLKVVHKVKFSVDDPHDLVRWHQYGHEFDYSGVHQGNVPLAQTTAGIRGTSIFYRWGMYGDFWRASVTGFGMPRPGQHTVYSCVSVLKGPKARENLDTTLGISRRTIGEDKDILNTIHYRQGTLTKGDRTLAQFLRYLRGFPRAHPSGPYIR